MNIFKELAANRFLIWTFAAHDFRSQYLGSILGFVWAMIKPLIIAGIYVLIFSSVVPPENSSAGNTSYFGLYVFAGMLPWFVIQESVQRGSTVLLDHAHLIRNHKLPLYILPLHIVISATVSGILAIIVFMGVKIFFVHEVGISFVLIALILPLQILYCWGLTMLISTAHVFLRDISHLTIAMLTIWFFASPIVFTVESLPWFLTMRWVNPLVSLTAIYRDLLLFQRLPAIIDITWFALHTVVVLMIGGIFYQKTCREVVDLV
ncbi:MAG: ABC transporter permease [Proteobacteria bacterium]|nr:ABC transporter permease [Pseudomonadota bacterium]MBU1715632.1 ABC transporter permease [Pseudomonadota bacterium]